MSLFLGQLEKLAELSEAGAGRQEFDHVSKIDAKLVHLDGGNFVAIFFQFGTQFFLEQIGH